MKKTVSAVCNILGTLILIAIIVLAGTVLLFQMLGKKPMAILSGSMEPAYKVGGLIFIDTKVTPEEVETGDVVSYYINEDTVVTHRVIGIDPVNREFETKGDNNNTPDLAAVSWDNMFGRAWLYIPQAGYALMNLRTVKGFGAGIIIIAVLIVLFVVPAILAPPKQKPVPAEKGVIDNDKN